MINVDKKFEDFKVRLKQEFSEFKADSIKWYNEIIRPMDKKLSQYGLQTDKNPRISSKECIVHIQKINREYGDNEIVSLRFQRGQENGLLDNWTDKVYYCFEKPYNNDYGSANYYDFFKKLFIYFNIENKIVS